MRPLIATLLSAVLILSAQQATTPAPPAPKGVGKFDITSQLVVVDVTAKDKSGAPMKGLKAGDFVITEDGKKQDIKVFEFQELEETVIPEPTLQQRPATSAPAAV